MEENKFIRSLAKDFSSTMDGDTLIIRGIDYYPESVNYSDEEIVKVVASNAVHTADGFYDLIHRNCDTNNPDISHGAYLEMYLALAGLACEIYIKSIIYNENSNEGKQIKGHKLGELLSKLPIRIQNQIKRAIYGISERINTVGDVFSQLRYDFELPQIQADYLIVFKLMEELKTISHTYPENKATSIRYLNGTLFIDLPQDQISE